MAKTAATMRPVHCKACFKPIGYKAVGDVKIRSKPNGKGLIVGTAYAHPNRRIRGHYHTECLRRLKGDV